jgi:hypothetical protein
MVVSRVPNETIAKIDDMIGTPVSAGKSCPSSIAIVLKNILKEFEGNEYEQIPYQKITKEEVQTIKIKECKHPNMQNVEGCVICPDCGFSKCS